MARASANLEKWFFSGDYRKVLDLTLDHPSGKWAAGNFAYVLNALCFVGRSDEAETLFRAREAELSNEALIQCRSALAMALTRRSEYAKARAYLALNLRMLSDRHSHRSRFFVYQGLGFYRYFCGKWRLALRDATRAQASALRGDFIWGRALSSDLRGHLLVQMGQIPHGLKVLQEAQALARSIGNAGFGKAIEVARLNYESQFGLVPGKAVERLLRHAELAASTQDVYSHAAFQLELARQYLLRGQFKDSSKVLDQAAFLIYSQQNRRQEVTLNLRYAHLAALSGDPARALSFVQSGKRALDPVVDHALRLALLGMEHGIAKSQGLESRREAIEQELRAISRSYGGAINRKILARAGVALPAPPAMAGDRLGDVLDRIRAADSEAGAAGIAIESGYLAFLLEVFPECRGCETLALELEGASLTAFDRDGIEHSAGGLTPLLRALLLRLNASGDCSKESLARTVWKYPAYRPLYHNPVIYQAITSLRKLLGTRAEWIQTTEQGYRLKPGVRLRAPAVETAKSIVPVETIQPFSETNPLNHRQLKWLRTLKPQEFLSVHDYRRLFKVSELTAGRDLADLKQRGYVVRVGNARATRYTLATKPFSP